MQQTGLSVNHLASRLGLEAKGFDADCLKLVLVFSSLHKIKIMTYVSFSCWKDRVNTYCLPKNDRCNYILDLFRVGLGLVDIMPFPMKNISANSCLAVCVSGQHRAHIPQMMSTPYDVMVLISRASVVGFGFSAWREKEKQDEVKCFDGVGQWNVASVDRFIVSRRTDR